MHIITSEYPPQLGGVSDYTQLVATGLAATGDEVHVWCPSSRTLATEDAHDERATAAGVIVHREFGRFTPADLLRAGKLLDQFNAPRRLLVQWVPHGYGYRSMNLPFCLWLWQRAKLKRDQIELMVHEPYLAFAEGSWKQSGVAAVHRLMTIALLHAARRVWMSIPAWEKRLRPYTLSRGLPFCWLPVASNIAVADDPDGVRIIRSRYAPEARQIVGHFGTFDRHITELLLKAVPALLRGQANLVMLLLGRGGQAMREQLLRTAPELAGQLHATGALAARELSLHISACDVLLQPYIDGVSSRRTSVMVGLSHGVPIVTTSGKLTEPLWAESRAVVLVPVENISALPELALSLLTDTDELRAIGKRARDLYQERFDIRHTISSLRAV